MEDLLYPFLKLYRALPFSVQAGIGRVYRTLPTSMRHGAAYRAYLDRIARFEALGGDADRQQAVVLDLLNTTLARAAGAPAYADYRPLREPGDLAALPVIDKQTINADRERFVNPQYARLKLTANTGGSSGNPMVFYIQKHQTRAKEKAHFDWYWGKYGYREGHRVLTIRGASLKDNALYQRDPIKNSFNLSCYELDEGRLPEVLDALDRFRPTVIHAYPSALKVFTDLCLTSERNRPRLQALGVDTLFLGSEFLPDSYRALFEECYGAPAVNWYGHSECVVHAGQLPGDRRYRLFPFYGYCELLDDDDGPVTTPGRSGRIVTTSFDNHVMPLIRYDTGDRAVYDGETDVDGYRCLTLSAIDGRNQDFIVLSDGNRVSLTAFIFGQHLAAFAKVRELQLQQDTIGEVVVRIVRAAGFAPSDEAQLCRELSDSVNGRIAVRVEFVDRIPKTHRGKHRFLIQNVPTT